MKKFLILLLLAFTTGICNAQNEFKLQEDGSFKLENGANFYVLIDSCSKEELYNKVLTNITKLYVSPKDVINKVDNEMITVNGVSSTCTSVKALGFTIFASCSYVLQFQFKEGKIRVNAPIINKMFWYGKPLEKFDFNEWLNTNNVFKRGKPNPKREATIEQLNSTMNEVIKSIMSYKQEADW